MSNYLELKRQISNGHYVDALKGLEDGKLDDSQTAYLKGKAYAGQKDYSKASEQYNLALKLIK